MAKDSVLLIRKITEYLEANGIGTIGTDLWLFGMPDAPVVGTVVAHVGGISLPDDPTRRPAITIQHRNKSLSAGLLKAVEIHNLVDDKTNVLSKFPGRLIVSSEAGAYFRDDSGNMIFPLAVTFVTTHQE